LQLLVKGKLAGIGSHFAATAGIVSRPEEGSRYGSGHHKPGRPNLCLLCSAERRSNSYPKLILEPRGY